MDFDEFSKDEIEQAEEDALKMEQAEFVNYALNSSYHVDYSLFRILFEYSMKRNWN